MSFVMGSLNLMNIGCRHVSEKNKLHHWNRFVKKNSEWVETSIIEYDTIDQLSVASGSSEVVIDEMCHDNLVSPYLPDTLEEACDICRRGRTVKDIACRYVAQRLHFLSYRINTLLEREHSEENVV